MLFKQIISRSGNLENLASDIDATILSFDFERILRDEIYNNHNYLRVFSDCYQLKEESIVAQYLYLRGSESERRRTIAKCHVSLFNVSEAKADRIFRLLNTSEVNVE